MRAIPTNIISGFLGVGKTTTILSLLKNKPQQERWAVLVNEFGEIGIDGSLLLGEHSNNKDIFIQEVPGGCMCCAAGVPMSVALNQLLIRAKPQKLLIEPTGLGHPREILEILTAENYRSVLDIQKNITLVDARKLTNPRYTNHDTFNQQIDIADIIVGNKSDLYQNNEQLLLQDYINKRKKHDVKIIFAAHGHFDPSILQGTSEIANQQIQHKHLHSHDTNTHETPMPDAGYIKAENFGEGFHSIGWRFSADKIFKQDALIKWFSCLTAERIKAVFITNEGMFSYNQVDDVISHKKLNTLQESRIELIAQKIEDHWESGLMDCLISNLQAEKITDKSPMSMSYANS